MFIGAVADDLTGATDLALMFAREGMRVVQVMGVPAAGALPDADAVVVALKSRTAPVAQAVEQSRAAAEALLAAGTQQLFFKYCSTFDSTPAGNIGPVIDALLELVGERTTIACPAFPANGRTVYNGHLFVGQMLLSDSSMKDHPLTPMRDSSLIRLLQPQTKQAVWLVGLPSVRATGSALGDAIRARDGVAIVDAVEDADLRAIGRAVDGLRLVTGGSGVGLGLPANFGFTGGHEARRIVAPAGRIVAVAGSCSEATRRQVQFAIQSGQPALQLDPQRIASGSISVADAVAFVLAADAGSLPVVYSSAAPDSVAASRAALGANVGEVVENFLAEVAVRLEAAGVTRFIVAGGETSGAVVNRLKVGQLEIGPEIAPGVPWTLSAGRQPALALALKSGNFGGEDFFVRAQEMVA